MTKKKYDPLWEVVGEKYPLQGAEPDIDSTCPWCHVTVHLGKEATAGKAYSCGLCGGVSIVVEEGGRLTLKRAK